MKKTPQTYTQRKRNLWQSCQNHYNSRFNLNKQAHAQYEAALQKEQRMPRATLWSYHPYLMKALIKKRNNQKSYKTTSITHNEEDPPNRNQVHSTNFRREIALNAWIFRQPKLINNSNKGKHNASKARKIPSIYTQTINNNKIQKNQAQALEKSRTT